MRDFADQGIHTDMPHTGLENTPRFNLGATIHYLLELLYRDAPLPYLSRSKAERNTEIRKRFADGETVTQLAEAYNISSQRIH